MNLLEQLGIQQLILDYVLSIPVIVFILLVAAALKFWLAYRYVSAERNRFETFIMAIAYTNLAIFFMSIVFGVVHSEPQNAVVFRFVWAWLGLASIYTTTKSIIRNQRTNGL